MALPENAVEPVEESSQQPVALHLRLEQQRGQRGTEREGVEGRQDHGNRNGHGELLVEPSRDSGNERGGNEHRRENQRDADHGTRDLFHRFERRVLGSQPILNVALHGLHHDDGIVHHQADRQNQSEQRKRVDGKTEEREEDECTDQRDRDRQQRNQRGAPALQEDVDHNDHQHDRDHQRFDDLPHSLRHRARRVERNRRSPHPAGKRFFASVISLFTPSAAWTALEPGNWYTAMIALGFPLKRPTME